MQTHTSKEILVVVYSRLCDTFVNSPVNILDSSLSVPFDLMQTKQKVPKSTCTVHTFGRCMYLLFALKTTSERLDSNFFFHFEIVVHFLRLLINKLCVSLKLLLLVQTECNEKKSKHDAF